MLPVCVDVTRTGRWLSEGKGGEQFLTENEQSSLEYCLLRRYSLQDSNPTQCQSRETLIPMTLNFMYIMLGVTRQCRGLHHVSGT